MDSFEGSLAFFVQQLHGLSASMSSTGPVAMALAAAEVNFQSVLFGQLPVWVSFEAMVLFQPVRSVFMGFSAQEAYFFCLNY